MNELFGFGRHYCYMAEEGGAGGEGAGGGAGSVSAGGSGGGDGGSQSGADGGEGGAGNGGAPNGGAGALGGAGQSSAGGEGGENKGALGGAGQPPAPIDWENVTDSELFARVQVPKIDGLKFDVKAAEKMYGQLCRENKIEPSVISKFLELEGKAFAAKQSARVAEAKKASAELQKNFNAQGEALHKTFNDQQIGTACDVLAKDFAGDKDFMKVATRELSNNSTLVKLLLNWREHHQTDGGTGLNGGTGTDNRGFASRWTGKNI